MIKEVHIIHRISGVPLLHINLNSSNKISKLPSTLFSGVLHGIRSFLKEAKIGDLNEFITNENRVEVRLEEGILIALIADINDPPHEIVDKVTEDLGALFVSQFSKEIELFEGEISVFEPFVIEIENYLEILSGKELKIEELEISNKPTQGIQFNTKLKPFLNYLTEWVKNRFDMEASLKNEVIIVCPPNKIQLKVDLLLEGNSRKMSRLDQWLGKRMYPGSMKNIFFIIELSATHGPAQIRQILEKAVILGKSEFLENPTFYPWFPAGIAFIGTNMEKSSFDGLDDLIKSYKGKKIIIPKYTGHIHRKHTPHHIFLQCIISGWKWNLKRINSENFPIQIYP